MKQLVVHLLYLRLLAIRPCHDSGTVLLLIKRFKKRHPTRDLTHEQSIDRTNTSFLIQQMTAASDTANEQFSSILTQQMNISAAQYVGMHHKIIGRRFPRSIIYLPLELLKKT